MEKKEIKRRKTTQTCRDKLDSTDKEILSEYNDVTNTDPHHVINTTDKIETVETKTMTDKHCPLTREQEEFKASISLPSLFDPESKCEDNCYLFSECLINYCMKLAFLNAIFLILAIVLFALIMNCFKNILEVNETKEQTNIKNQRNKKSILRRV